MTPTNVRTQDGLIWVINHEGKFDVDLFDVVRSCFRRWYVVLPLLLITAWYAHHLYTSMKPVYYSNAVVSLAPPNSRVYQLPDGGPVPQNGLLESAGGPTMIANLVTLSLKDPSVVARVVEAGGKRDYNARMFPVPANSPELPLIMIEATEPDPTSATKTVELVEAQADPTLRTFQQQAGVPDDQMVKALVVSPPTAPLGGIPSRTRSTVAIFAAGAGLAILIGVVVDLGLIRWKARRQKSQQRKLHATREPHTAETPSAHPHNQQAAVNEIAIDRR
jgi:hypothetical protein